MQQARPVSHDDSHGRGPLRISPWLAIVGFAAVLATVMAGVYHPVLSAGFVDADDVRVVEGARRDDWMWRSDCWDFALRLVSGYPGGGAGPPLTRVSYVIDLHFARQAVNRAFAFHLTNFGLHLANSVLLCFLLRRLGVRLEVCLLCAAVFALHPIQLAALASAARRGVLLGTFFSLLTMRAYVRYVESRRQSTRALVLLLYAGAFFCESSFVVLPLVLILLDVWPLNRFGRGTIVEKWPLLMMGVLWTIVASLRVNWGAVQLGAGPFKDAAANLASILMRFLLPWRLSPFYPEQAVPPLGVMVATCVLFAGLIIWSARRSKALFVALAGTGVMLAPLLLTTPGSGLMGDGWLYAVWVVPVLVGGVLLSVWVNKAARGQLILIVTVGLVLALTMQTYAYAMNWNNRREMYQYALQRYPTWAGGYVGLAEAAIGEYDLDTALKYAEKAVEADPTEPMTQFYMGTVLLLHQDGRAAKAIAPLRRALQANPNWAECLQNLGVALARNGNHAQAVGYLEKARDLAPASAGVRVALGHVYLQLDRAASARAEFQEALKYRPDAVVNLGLAASWAGLDVPRMAQRHLAVAVAENAEAAGWAGRFPKLKRYEKEPGFENLFAEDAGQRGLSENANFPAASGANTSKVVSP